VVYKQTDAALPKTEMKSPGILTRNLRATKWFFTFGRQAGWQAALADASVRVKRRLGLPEPRVLCIKPRFTKYPVLARLGNSSDLDVFSQIFRFDEYACLRHIPSPRFILDLGANVGYSSAYFLSCFPGARLLAVEPDPSNFELLRRNLAAYGDRAGVVLGAAWSHNSKLELSRGFGDGREWATQVVPSEDAAEGSVEGFDIPTLLSLAGVESIDLLKVDIERSELELFDRSSSTWLPKVRNICIELHGNDCRAAFMSALAPFDYDLTSSGELTICRNLRRRASSPAARSSAALGA